MALNTTVSAQVLLKEGEVTFINLTIVWPQAKQPGGSTALPIKSTGTTQRDGMGREEGGGLGMGNTCIPVADSF